LKETSEGPVPCAYQLRTSAQVCSHDELADQSFAENRSLGCIN